MNQKNEVFIHQLEFINADTQFQNISALQDQFLINQKFGKGYFPLAVMCSYLLNSVLHKEFVNLDNMIRNKTIFTNENHVDFLRSILAKCQKSQILSKDKSWDQVIQIAEELISSETQKLFEKFEIFEWKTQQTSVKNYESFLKQFHETCRVNIEFWDLDTNKRKTWSSQYFQTQKDYSLIIIIQKQELSLLFSQSLQTLQLEYQLQITEINQINAANSLQENLKNILQTDGIKQKRGELVMNPRKNDEGSRENLVESHLNLIEEAKNKIAGDKILNELTINNLHKEVESLHSQIDSLQKDRMGQQSEIQKLKSKLQAEQQQNKQLSQSIQFIHSFIHSGESQNQQQKTQYSQLDQILQQFLLSFNQNNEKADYKAQDPQNSIQQSETVVKQEYILQQEHFEQEENIDIIPNNIELEDSFYDDSQIRETPEKQLKQNDD